jgi:hypothetical protein
MCGSDRPNVAAQCVLTPGHRLVPCPAQITINRPAKRNAFTPRTGAPAQEEPHPARLGTCTQRQQRSLH